ncbi:MAG: di- and tricarboxylate transporter [Candidatus Hydrogenedentota bacterium]
MSDNGDQARYPLYRRAGLFGGILAFAACLAIPTPVGMSGDGQRVAAVALLMGVWWVTEAIPIAAASLAPLALFPALGVMSGKDTALCYGDSTVFLFAGGFFISMAMQQWRLHERVALRVIRRTGTNPRRLVLGFMCASAFISLWISNAATTMMMIPVAIAVIEQIKKDETTPWVSDFAVTAMLGIAYASSIGGVGTLVGTAPNIVCAGIITKLFPEAPRISFGQWILFGLPMVIVIVPLAWVVLVRFIFPLPGHNAQAAAGREAVDERLRLLGPMVRGEKVVLAVSITTALAWIFRADLALGAVTIPGWSSLFPNGKYIEDGTVAIAFALLLFLIPVDLKRGRFALEWDWAVRIPWGILLLFGGGFAIAQGFDETGLVEWAGSYMRVLDGLPPIAVVFVVALTITFMSEFMSNTAQTALMLPILAAAATSALNLHPLLLMIPATFSASLAFMMPAGTPPNAMVFGSGYVTIPQMAKAGFWLNVIGIVVLTIMTFLVINPVLNITPTEIPAWVK